MKIDSDSILKFGNELTVKGLVFGNTQGDDLAVYLPGETATTVVSFFTPNTQQLFDIFQQLDKCFVKTDHKGVVAKGQRLLDNKICWEVYRRDKYACRYCGINNVPLTVDHIVTWESGGATHKDNLLTCCRKCNRKRGNLDYGSWLEHKYYMDKAAKYLTQKQIEANQAIVRLIPNLPRVVGEVKKR